MVSNNKNSELMNNDERHGNNYMDKKIKMYNNHYSSILIDNNSIQVLRNSDKMFSPRSIKIYSGMQIELGRPVSNFIDALAESRLPLMIKDVPLPVDGVLGYQVVRMHTGNVDDRVLANLIEKNGQITKITFNRDLAHDKEFMKYSPVPIVNQLKLKAIDINNSEKLKTEFVQQLNNVIQVLFRNTATFLSAEYATNEVCIHIDADEQKQKISFIFSKKSGYYELMSVATE